jgi:DNA-binding transcriptional regulator GbsR (MarR family)
VDEDETNEVIEVSRKNVSSGSKSANQKELVHKNKKKRNNILPPK